MICVRKTVQKCTIPPVQQYNLVDYQFSDFHMDDDETLKATVRMFLDLSLMEKFHIQNEVQNILKSSCIKVDIFLFF